MKILCLSDLHRWGKNKPQDRALQALVEETEPDVIVVSGDVHESEHERNAYKDLSKVFFGTKVIFTLGNHEFFNYIPEQVLKRYTKEYRPEKWDVHCLDVLGHYDIDDVRFMGNVLWYDGSMSGLPMQNLYDFAGGSWADRLIREFDYSRECKACKDQIEKAISEAPNYITTKVLVTHCVPHHEMNGHMETKGSPFNAFSGVYDYLEQLEDKGLGVDYSISGHTHWRIIGKTIGGAKCVNVGSDYHNKLEHYVLEV